jgi:hypothetical protein
MTNPSGQAPESDAFIKLKDKIEKDIHEKLSATANNVPKYQGVNAYCPTYRQIMLAAAIAALSIIVPFALTVAYPKFYGTKFAFQTTDNSTMYPAAVHSRYRYDEFQPTLWKKIEAKKSAILKQNATASVEIAELQSPPFFQWWNFLIVDQETGRHWTILYGYTKFDHNPESSGAAQGDYAAVAFHYRVGSERVAYGDQMVTFNEMKVKNDFDVTIGNSLLRVVNDDTYQITGKVTSSDDETISWDLKLDRVHGAYLSQDQEVSAAELCKVVSTLWGYNSAPTGTIRIGSQVFDISNTEKSRFRTYAAGSYGCELPSGEPAVEYPWSWFWIVIPGEFSSSEDISMVGGTGDYQKPIDIHGGYAILGLSDFEMHALRFAEVLVGNFKLGVQASSTDGAVSHYEVTRSNWATFQDEFGIAQIPLSQKFSFGSKHLDISLDFRSSLDQYFRLPIFLKREGKEVVYSDLRAVNVPVSIKIVNKTDSRVLYDAEIETINSLEYAYEAPYQQN